MTKTEMFTTGFVLLLVGVIVSYFVFKDRSTGSKLESDPRLYEKVEIRSLDESESFGFVWVQDATIQSDITIGKIRDFIDSKKESWETEKQEYPTGGMDERGALWDGAEETSIGDRDFMLAIYVQLDDKFAKDYSIHPIEK